MFGVILLWIPFSPFIRCEVWFHVGLSPPPPWPRACVHFQTAEGTPELCGGDLLCFAAAWSLGLASAISHACQVCHVDVSFPRHLRPELQESLRLSPHLRSSPFLPVGVEGPLSTRQRVKLGRKQLELFLRPCSPLPCSERMLPKDGSALCSHWDCSPLSPVLWRTDIVLYVYVESVDSRFSKTTKAPGKRCVVYKVWKKTSRWQIMGDGNGSPLLRYELNRK